MTGTRSWLGTNNAGDLGPNSDIGNQGAQMLLTNVTDTRNAIAALNLDKTLPIGTADAGSFFNTELLQQVDFGMSNIHAWFANVSVEQSAGWVADFFQTENVDAANALPNKPKMFIAETGWPTVSFLGFEARVGAEDVMVCVCRLPRMLETRAMVLQLRRSRTSRYLDLFSVIWFGPDLWRC